MVNLLSIEKAGEVDFVGNPEPERLGHEAAELRPGPGHREADPRVAVEDPSGDLHEVSGVFLRGEASDEDDEAFRKGPWRAIGEGGSKAIVHHDRFFRIGPVVVEADVTGVLADSHDEVGPLDGGALKVIDPTAVFRSDAVVVERVKVKDEGLAGASLDGEARLGGQPVMGVDEVEIECVSAGGGMGAELFDCVGQVRPVEVAGAVLIRGKREAHDRRGGGNLRLVRNHQGELGRPSKSLHQSLAGHAEAPADERGELPSQHEDTRFGHGFEKWWKGKKSGWRSIVNGDGRHALCLDSLRMETDESTTFEKDNYLETGMPAEAGELFPGQVVAYSETDGQVVFWCDNLCALAVTFPSEGVVRFRFAPGGDYSEDFSYAVSSEVHEGRVIPRVTEEEEAFVLRTDDLVVILQKAGLKMRVEDPDGTVLSQDEKGFHWYRNDDFGGEIVMTSRVIQPSEHFYGLGDVPGHKNLRGQRCELWGSDVYGYNAETSPLYKNIPFFIGVHHGKAYGIFFDNTFRSHFDFGHERSSVSTFWAQGGEMNYYFIKGPTVPEVVAGYAGLTGTPELPPLWALGFHQCKWSYQSETEVLAIAREFETRKIPCDAIYVDIDYMDGFRCFTWNRREGRFPNPGGLSSSLAKKGIKLMAIIDPGIKVDPDYEIYQRGKAGGVFCKRMDGPLMTGNVWPGPCHFPDFTDPRVREWWADLFPPFMQEAGLAGIWTDMNEPAVFNEAKTFPRDVRHDFDGHPCSHRKAHNVYGMQMSRATQEGIRRALPGKRPFVITRSAYAGTQRYSSAWTGDIESTWEHLRIGNIQCQRLSLSGFSFVGTDIGGFSGRSDGELFVRWLQMGVFHPFCRVHSSGDQNEQEPWSFGEPYTSISKKFIELRYLILPYLYTLFEEHTRTGAPMLRSLIYLDASDPECHNRAEEFALGSALFTCPISKPGVEGRWIYPPKGRWYDFWTSEEVFGGEERWVDVPLDSTPLLVRAGTILPLSPVRASTAVPLDHLELHLYPDEGKATGSLYEDEGDGYGDHVRKTFVLKDGVLTQERVGGFKPSYDHYRITLRGGSWRSVVIDDRKPLRIKKGGSFEAPESFQKMEFTK